MLHTAPASSPATSNHALRRRVYAPVLLCIIAALAAGAFLNPGSGPGPFVSQASAQPASRGGVVTTTAGRENAAVSTNTDDEDSTGRVSAAEQRKEIILQLRGISTRLERLESALARGISVKVTDMPAMRATDDADPQPTSAAPRTAPPVQPRVRIRP
mgnify:CR=1 FL=1